MALNEIKDEDVVYYLRDINKQMVLAWAGVFSDYKDTIKVSDGDIFRGAPAVDAIVSPANSFGFMDGGIDMIYTRFFGSQMQKRLQKVIREEYDGELLVGQAIVIPTYPEQGRDSSKDWSQFNEGKPINYLISAPTMRVPVEVPETVNAYLAFRAVVLAVRKHNRRGDCSPIRSVLVPGLATAVGKMPPLRCAWQMLQAYETFALGHHESRRTPGCLLNMYVDQEKMMEEEKYVASHSDDHEDGPYGNKFKETEIV